MIKKHEIIIKYILVEGFKEKKNAKVDDPGKLDVQLQLLAHIFKLGDLSDTNYGINSQQELVIVDFMVITFFDVFNLRYSIFEKKLPS